MLNETKHYDIRPAHGVAERAAAYRLRYELYVEQQGLFGDRADHVRRWLVEPEDEQSTIWIAEHEGEVVGTARLRWGREGFDAEVRESFDTASFSDIVPESAIAIGERMLVRADHRGGAVVASLMGKMWAHAIELGIELILADCEPHLLNTWICTGFRPYGLFEHPRNGTLVRCAFVLGDLEHTRRMSSPLATTLEGWTGSRARAGQLGARLRTCTHVSSQRCDRAGFHAAIERSSSKAALASLIGGLSSTELDELLRNAHVLDCPQGAKLICKGHVSRTLYLLLDGSLDVVDRGRRVAEVREVGAILGEVALFAKVRRTSDVVASQHGARVLALCERSVLQLIGADTPAAAKFLRALTRDLCLKLGQRSSQALEPSMSIAS